MKYIFIKPVDYIFSQAPIIGIPTLIGILEQNGFNSKFIDLNIDFLNNSLEREFITYLENFEGFYSNIKTDNKNSEIINEIILYSNKNLSRITSEIKNLSKNLESTKYIIKNEKLFYDKYLCEFAVNNLNYYTKIFAKTNDIFFTQKLIPDVNNFRTFSKEAKFSINIDAIKEYFEKNLSLLDKYYDKIIEEILNEQPECIGINISMTTSFISGLLLCSKLKKKTSAHINIGGSFFNIFFDLIINFKDILKTFCDSISIKDNTKTVIELMKYLKNEIPISQISNIFYLENEELKFNKQTDNYNISNLPFSSFNGYNLDKYFFPKRVLPVRASISCYWAKCIFCTCSGENNYMIKNAEKFIDEIEYLSKKYNTPYFYFWDNALPPEYLSNFADIILKRKIKIFFSFYARFEENFNYRLLKKLHKAGCIQIYWGLDSGSQAILDYINKGIKLKTAEKVLKISHKCNISNFIYLIFSHPTETKQDMQNTAAFIKNNNKYINAVNIAENIMIYYNSIMYQNRDYYKNKISYNTEEKYSYINEIYKLIFSNRKVYTLNQKIPALHRFMYASKFGIKLKAQYILLIYRIHTKLLKNTLYKKFLCK